jgi:hypothetical protein
MILLESYSKRAFFRQKSESYGKNQANAFDIDAKNIIQ